MTGGPLDPQGGADRAYAHALVASGAAHRITRDIAAIAAAFDAELAALTAADDTPITELAVVR